MDHTKDDLVLTIVLGKNNLSLLRRIKKERYVALLKNFNT